MADFLPRKEDLLLGWSLNFSRRISESPGEYGLTMQQADDYAALHAAFAAALQKTARPVRSMVTVCEKNEAMQQLKTAARQLSMLVKGTAAVTAAQRLDLGINPGITHATRAHAPAGTPSIVVEEVRGATAFIKIEDSFINRRGKPPGIHGATLFTFVGANPPPGVSGWTFHSTTTARRVQVDFPDIAPGQEVWFTACWLNARLQRGPWSAPRSTRLPGGAGMMISSMRVAA